MPSVVVFGSIGVAVGCLEWLLSQPDYQVLGVVCSPDPVSKWRQLAGDRNMAEEAPRLGVPILALDDVSTADLGLSIRFNLILRQRHLDRFGLGVINLHGAPLPEMRGSMCDAAAIAEGREQYGTSLHWMDTGIDTGDVLCVERFPIAPTDRGCDLFHRSNALGLQLIKDRLAAIVAGDVRGVRQGPGRTYRQAEVEALRRMPADLPGIEVERRRRAFDFPGFPPAYFVAQVGAESVGRSAAS